MVGAKNGAFEEMGIVASQKIKYKNSRLGAARGQTDFFRVLHLRWNWNPRKILATQDVMRERAFRRRWVGSYVKAKSQRAQSVVFQSVMRLFARYSARVL